MKRTFLLLLSLGVFFTSCADLNDGKAMNPDRVIEELKKTDCEVNTDNLENILSQPITSDINCIYDQLSVLLDLVRSERPDLDGGKNITRRTLENFILRYVPNAVEALEYFDIFFTLNGFLFGSDDDILIQNDFRRLKDFLVMMNLEISEIYPHLEKLDEDERIGIRFHTRIKEEKILRTFNYVVRDARTSSGENISLLGLLEVRPTLEREIDVPRLIELFENDDNADSIKEIKNFVFLKRVVMGGAKFFLKNTELVNFLREDLTDFVNSFYDIYRHPNLAFDSEEKRHTLYQSNIDRIGELIVNVDDSESLVDFYDVFEVLNYYREDLLGKYSVIDFHTIAPELLRLKQIFFGQDEKDKAEVFTRGDFNTIISEAKAVVGRSIKNSILFEDNKDYLISTRGRIRDGSRLRTDLPADDNDLKSFIDTITKFRYFKGEDILPSFGNEIHRKIETINLIGTLDYFVDKMFAFYEKEYPCHESKVFDIYNYGTDSDEAIHPSQRCKKEDENLTLNAAQLNFIVLEFRKILYETKIVVDTREDKAGSNAVNIPDLFLETANDDGFLQVPEFLEFVLSLFDSISVRDKVFPFIADNCRIVDDTPEFSGARYEAKCVRDLFYQSLTRNFTEDNKEFRYFDFFPKFEARYNEWSQRSDSDKFLRRYTLLLEGFTKTCAPYDNIPYSQADVMGLYTSVFTVESVMNKFDKDGDNIIDRKEAKDTYKHFERGLKSILRDEGGKNFGWLLASFSKQFFKFLIDKKRLPLSTSGFFKDIGDVLNLLGPYSVKRFSEINREKIITILATLQSTGEKQRKIRLDAVGKLYEDKDQFCSRTNPDVGEFVSDEWKCYVENKKEFCP